MNNYLGIDIGGTNVAYGVVNSEFGFIYQNTLKTKSAASADALATLIYDDLKTNAKLDFAGIGIGAPSVNSFSQQIEFAPNLPWGDIVPLNEIFKAKFNQAVVLINDANAAAVGEKYFGDAKALKNFAVVTLGTGIGLGLYLHDKLYSGDNGLAGELGHSIIHIDGRECKCGNLGCLETYVGKKGIIRTAKEKLEFSSGGSFLNSISPSAITPLEIFKAAKKEDPVALEVVDIVSRDLGFSLAYLVNILDIETVYLTGGIAKSGNLFRKKVEKFMRQYTLPNIREKVSIKLSDLNEKGGAILGAAAAIKEKVEMTEED